LDQLTKDFFTNKFPGYYSNHTDNIPILELPLNVDVAYIQDLLKDKTPNKVVRNSYPGEISPRFYNWSMEVLWSSGNLTLFLSDIYYKKPGTKLKEQVATNNDKLVKDYLLLKGLDIEVCMLSVFEPGGYLRPHRDIALNPNPLNYFWLPLDNPQGAELKIYPYGTVNVNLGNIYLLNQENFVHAVKNDSCENRHVLVGHVKNFDSTVEQIIEKEIDNQYPLTR